MLEKKVGLNIILKLGRELKTSNEAKQVCKKFLKEFSYYEIHNDINYCYLEGIDSDDLVIIENIKEKVIMRESTLAEYGIYFREYKSIATKRDYEQ